MHDQLVGIDGAVRGLPRRVVEHDLQAGAVYSGESGRLQQPGDLPPLARHSGVAPAGEFCQPVYLGLQLADLVVEAVHPVLCRANRAGERGVHRRAQFLAAGFVGADCETQPGHQTDGRNQRPPTSGRGAIVGHRIPLVCAASTLRRLR